MFPRGRYASAGVLPFSELQILCAGLGVLAAWRERRLPRTAGYRAALGASRNNFTKSDRSHLTPPEALRLYRGTLGTDECSSSSFAKSGISGPRRGPGGGVLLGGKRGTFAGGGRGFFTAKKRRSEEGARLYHECTRTR